MVLAEAEIERLAGSIEVLRSPAAERLVGRRPCPVETYLRLLADAHRLDLTGDDAQSFRRTFNGYYGVRRGGLWRDVFYNQFERAKGMQADFATILGAVYAATGRVEASFVSKLMATLDPDLPIVDSVVRAFLTRHVQVPPAGGATGAVAFHGFLTDTMNRLRDTPQAKAWSDQFTDLFSHVDGVLEISQTKRLDFLIWAGSR